jgi:vancomycin permeability regulator SanA
VIGCAPKKDGRPSNCMISRVRKAVQLYRKNNYSKVLISGGPSRLKIPKSEVMRIMLLNFVPNSKIITEHHAINTVQNAVFCWEMLKDKKPKHITIVTSEHHLRRTRYIYIFKKLYAHMGVSLKFEPAEDTFDIVEAAFFHLKELVLLIKIKLFGFK